MANAFDQSEYPTREPETLVIGDRWTWRKELSDYAVGTYTLSYEARSHDAVPNRIEITATNDGTDYIVEVGASTTAGLEAGTYNWHSFITRNSDSERIRLESGTWEVKPNPETATGDPRSFAKRALDNIEDVIHGRATRDALASYSIGDRSLALASLQELHEARDYYRREVRRELQRERIARGLSSGTSIGVQF